MLKSSHNKYKILQKPAKGRKGHPKLSRKSLSFSKWFSGQIIFDIALVYIWYCCFKNATISRKEECHKQSKYFWWFIEEREQCLLDPWMLPLSQRNGKRLNRKQATLGPVQPMTSVQLNYIAVQVQQVKTVKIILLNNSSQEQNRKWKERRRKEACDLYILHVMVVYYLTECSFVARTVLDKKSTYNSNN